MELHIVFKNTELDRLDSYKIAKKGHYPYKDDLTSLVLTCDNGSLHKMMHELTDQGMAFIGGYVQPDGFGYHEFYDVAAANYRYSEISIHMNHGYMIHLDPDGVVKHEEITRAKEFFEVRACANDILGLEKKYEYTHSKSKGNVTRS